MAITAGDGSIILETQVDTTGVTKGVIDIKSITERAGKGMRAFGADMTKSLNSGNLKIAQLEQNYNKATAAVAKQMAVVEELQAKLAGLQSGEIVVEGKGTAKLQSDFDKATASAQKTEDEIRRIYAELDQLQANAFRVPGTGEVLLTGEEQAQFDALNAKLDELEPKLETDKEQARQLGEQLREAVGAGTQAEIAATQSKLEAAGVKLTELSGKAEIAGEKLRESMVDTPAITSKVGAEFERLGNRITGLVKRVFIFSVITRALRAMLAVFKTVLMSNESFRNSLYQLQAALWVAFTPIMNFIVPVLQTLVNWLTLVMVTIAKFIAFLTGKSYSAMVDNGKSLKEQADAYKKVGAGGASAAKGMKKATDEAKKQLAAFDDLQILQSQQTEDAGSGGGGGGGGGALNFEPTDFQSQISNELAAIMAVAGGALIAIGLILLFSGHPVWGISFIIAGAATLGVAMQQLADKDIVGEISGKLIAIMAIAGTALLAIGLILLVNGTVKWGVACLITGITALGVTVVATKNGKVEKDTANMLIGILTVAGGAMLALGLILVCFGVVSPISIGLIMAGSATLVTGVAIDPQYVLTQVSNFFKNNAALVVGVSLALLVLGIILLVCGIVTPLTIGLVVVGATGLVAEIALNWDKINNSVDEFFKNNAALVVGVSLALLVLGIILCCTGVALPLGIALIVVGAGELAVAASLNWDTIKEKVSTAFNNAVDWVKSNGLLILGIILVASGIYMSLGLSLIKQNGENLTEAQEPMWDKIVEKVKEVWGNIKTYWKNNIAKYFTAEWWGDLGKKAINGLIKWIINGLNKLIEKVNSFGFDLPGVLGGKHIGFTIPKIPIPQLAQGAVIPPNRAFMAVLGDQKSGTNIEAPLDTIVEAMNIALQNRSATAGNVEVVLQVDGREFGRAVVELGNQEARRVGTRLVMA